MNLISEIWPYIYKMANHFVDLAFDILQMARFQMF